MALRNIVKAPDELLRKKSRPVEKIDEKLLTLLDDMAETMYASEGVGLAAVQVGILRRVVVIDIGQEDIGLIELINPVIKKSSGSQVNDEGCLSVEGRRGKVKRPAKLVVEAYDRNGDLIKYTAHGFLAVAMSHEIDHLEGVLFTDKLEEPEDRK